MKRLINLQISEELMEKLEEVKKKTGDSKSSIIRSGIRREIKRIESE